MLEYYCLTPYPARTSCHATGQGDNGVWCATAGKEHSNAENGLEPKVQIFNTRAMMHNPETNSYRQVRHRR